jgi:hypothetical protein
MREGSRRTARNTIRGRYAPASPAGRPGCNCRRGRAVGHEKDEDREGDQDRAGEPAVLGRVERMKRQGVALVLDIDPGRVARSGYVKRPDVQDHHRRDDERQQIVEREEAGQRRLVGRIAAKQPHPKRLSDHRYCAEKAGYDLGAPIAHLPPGKDVAHEGGRHHQQVDDEAQDPHQLARRLVAAVIDAPENVDVGDDEEEAGAVRMGVAEKPAGVDVAHDVFDRGEGPVRARDIPHRKDDSGQDLDHKEQSGEYPEIPPVIEVAGHRIATADRSVDEARKRQPLVDPAHERMLGFVGLGPGKAHLAGSLSRSRSSLAT